MNSLTDLVSATDLLELFEFSRAGYIPTSKWLRISNGKLWNCLHGQSKLTRRQHADLSTYLLEQVTARIARLCQALGR